METLRHYLDAGTTASRGSQGQWRPAQVLEEAEHAENVVDEVIRDLERRGLSGEAQRQPQPGPRHAPLQDWAHRESQLDYHRWILE